VQLAMISICPRAAEWSEPEQVSRSRCSPNIGDVNFH
jgi:hypothetical protein